MKITGKKIFLWSIWPILAIAFFGIYFLIPKESETDHLELIPSNADFVIVANPLVLFKTYARHLEDNPMLFKDLTFEIDEDALDKSRREGVDPISKFALYQFKKEHFNFRGIGILAKTNDFSSFVELFNQRDNKEEPTAYEGGKYLVMAKDEEFYLFKNGVAVRIIAQSSDITEAIVKECFNDVFEAKTHLVDIDPIFKKQITQNDQMTYWSGKDNNLAKELNPQLGVIFNLFDRKDVAINLTEKGFEIDALLELQEGTSIIDRQNPTELTLEGTECFRFAASVNPSKFSNFFDLIIPQNKKYLINDWNGGISASVNGFKNISIKKISPADASDLNNQDSLYPFKTVEKDLIEFEIPFAGGGLDELFSYPYFTVACELENIENVKTAISADSTISNVGEYYSFVLPNYVMIVDGVKSKQRVYFYFVDNSLVFCPELPEKEFIPQYNNFGLLYRFDPFFENYEYKSMMGDFALSKIKEFEFNGFEIRYVKSEEGTVKLKGLFDLKNTDNHLVGFPMLLKKISEMSFLSSLPAAF